MNSPAQLRKHRLKHALDKGNYSSPVPLSPLVKTAPPLVPPMHGHTTLHPNSQRTPTYFWKLLVHGGNAVRWSLGHSSLSRPFPVCLCPTVSSPEGKRAQGTIWIRTPTPFFTHHVTWSNFLPSLGLNASSIDEDKSFMVLLSLELCPAHAVTATVIHHTHLQSPNLGFTRNTS